MRGPIMLRPKPDIPRRVAFLVIPAQSLKTGLASV